MGRWAGILRGGAVGGAVLACSASSLKFTVADSVEVPCTPVIGACAHNRGIAASSATKPEAASSRIFFMGAFSSVVPMLAAQHRSSLVNTRHCARAISYGPRLSDPEAPQFHGHPVTQQRSLSRTLGDLGSEPIPSPRLVTRRPEAAVAKRTTTAHKNRQRLRRYDMTHLPVVLVVRMSSS